MKRNVNIMMLQYSHATMPRKTLHMHLTITETSHSSRIFVINFYFLIASRVFITYTKYCTEKTY